MIEVLLLHLLLVGVRTTGYRVTGCSALAARQLRAWALCVVVLHSASFLRHLSTAGWHLKVKGAASKSCCVGLGRARLQSRFVGLWRGFKAAPQPNTELNLPTLSVVNRSTSFHQLISLAAGTVGDRYSHSFEGVIVPQDPCTLG